MRQAFDVGLPAAVLNIIEKRRSNLFAWRGQFSPQLIEALVQAYAEPDSLVLDPFMGSGTVLAEGAALGHEVHGCEVNPAALAIARLYEFCNLDASAREALLAEVEGLLDKNLPTRLPLFGERPDRASENDAEVLRTALGARDERVRSVLQAYLVLFDSRDPSETSDAWGRWQAMKRTILSLPTATRPIRAHFADARRLPIRDRTVNFVVSSPPYVNVFNYHHNYRRAVESLGWDPLVIARSEIGSNRKFRQNRFLTVVQYSVDMALTLRELWRVCAEHARLLLILGKESNVQMTPFFNSSLVSSVAVGVCGYKLIFQQQRVFQNRFGQDIYEDILHLTPTVVMSQLDEQQSIASARRLAVDVLVEARNRVPTDKRVFLDQAIDDAHAVFPSPIADSARATTLVPSADR